MSSEAMATALCEKLFGHRYNDDEEEGHEKWMPCHEAILAAERDAAARERAKWQVAVESVAEIETAETCNLHRAYRREVCDWILAEVERETK